MSQNKRAVIVKYDPKTLQKVKFGCPSTYAAKKQIRSMMDLYPDCEFMIVYEELESQKASEQDSELYPDQE